MADSAKIELLAFKYAVKNAALHDGNANAGAVIGKLKALFPNEDIKQLSEFAQSAAKKTNALSITEIQKQFEIFEKEGYELKPREKEAGLPKLDWAERGEEKVVTRFAPNPSGFMHLGHCRPAITSGEYARKYGGTFLLRFDDTDPKTKKPVPNADKAFLEDLKWLGYPPDKTEFASDHFEKYYDYMKKTVKLEKAYVCTCDNEEFKKLKAKKTACPHRELDTKTQLKEFDKMLSHEYKEGQAVLRIKTDLSHPDPSVRDWWAAKIVDNADYPEPKKRIVFPSYNFASAIDDHELGVTLILRGQEHAQNATKQKFLYEYFGWRYPHLIHFGRLLVKDESMKLSKSAINKMQKQEGFLGFDDPRLGTLRAFRKKGFEPKAIVEFILEMGVNPQDAVVSVSKLEDLNKKIIDPISERIVFLQNPVELTVKNSVAMTVSLPKHPDFAEKGVKKYEIPKGEKLFWMDESQAKQLKVGQIVQLKQAYQIKIKKITKSKANKKSQNNKIQIEAEFAGKKFEKGISVVHWLLPAHTVNAEVVMPDAKTLIGVAEEELAKYRTGSHMQLERFGYCVVENATKKAVKLYFTQS